MGVGISSKAKELITTYNRETFSKTLNDYIEGIGFPVSKEQRDAWKNCFDFLSQELPKLPPNCQDVHLLFEYMLPLERGRRPDTIMLFEDKAVILEFKAKDIETTRDVEQAIGYREDIKHFHEATEIWDLEVESYLVLTKNHDFSNRTKKSIPIVNENNFLDTFKVIDSKPMDENKVQRWVRSKYSPIPNILEATKQLFETAELPYIKSIAEGDIAAATNAIRNLIIENEEVEYKKRLIFISGVPGSGKTLVGIKTVYDFNNYVYEKIGSALGAIYLSGNGPLVSVLQEQLSSHTVTGTEGKAYIKDMLSFKGEYLETDNIPSQKVIVFDEAQRAWDSKQMKKSYSEAEALLRIAEKAYKQNGSITVLCLIGDGQAIHTGEEKGMDLWKEALRAHSDWEVYLPEKYSEFFEGIKRKKVANELFLDVSIRNNFIDTSKWIEAILKGSLENAKKELEAIEEKGYRIRIQRDFSRIVKLMPKLEETRPKDRYGLLISSKASIFDRDIKRYTNGYYKSSFVKVQDAGKWYLHDCQQLHLAASEFLCQGLEIEMPIVIFGGDYYINKGKWTIDSSVNNRYSRQYEDLGQIIENIYRVLLSRGRHGMILYIPFMDKLNETYKFFLDMGIQSF